MCFVHKRQLFQISLVLQVLSVAQVRTKETVFLFCMFFSFGLSIMFVRCSYFFFGFLQGKDFQQYPPNIPRSPPKSFPCRLFVFTPERGGTSQLKIILLLTDHLCQSERGHLRHPVRWARQGKCAKDGTTSRRTAKTILTSFLIIKMTMRRRFLDWLMCYFRFFREELLWGVWEVSKMFFGQLSVNLSDEILVRFLARCLTRFLATDLTKAWGEKTMDTVRSTTRP